MQLQPMLKALALENFVTAGSCSLTEPRRVKSACGFIIRDLVVDARNGEAEFCNALTGFCFTTRLNEVRNAARVV